jgi:hypothetical protein
MKDAFPNGGGRRGLRQNQIIAQSLPTENCRHLSRRKEFAELLTLSSPWTGVDSLLEKATRPTKRGKCNASTVGALHKRSCHAIATRSEPYAKARARASEAEA